VTACDGWSRHCRLFSSENQGYRISGSGTRQGVEVQVFSTAQILDDCAAPVGTPVPLLQPVRRGYEGRRGYLIHPSESSGITQPFGSRDGNRRALESR
jgi:hypothetical protein